MTHFDTLILGAGASGLMAAAHLHPVRRIALIDANPRIGEKIRISGGGRCNVTNARVDPSHYLGDPAFTEPALTAYTNDDLLHFLNAHGCRPSIRFPGQYFCDHSSDEVLQVFRRLLSGVPIMTGTRIDSVVHNGLFHVHTSQGEYVGAQLIVATGGLSYTRIGASGIGYAIAEHFGHTVVSPQPALVGLTLQPDTFWMKALSGVTFPASATVGGKTFTGNLLFAHKGVSGPAILNASIYWKKGAITLDFLPGQALEPLLKPSKKQLSTLLPLPKRFCKAALDAIGVPDLPTQKLTAAHKAALTRLKTYAFAPSGTFGFTRAEVTRGGVNTDEIDPWTMQSRRQSGLYFIGEVLDVTGELGGYNFQWAFSSAVQCVRGMT